MKRTTKGLSAEAMALLVPESARSEAINGMWDDEENAVKELLLNVPEEGNIRHETLVKLVTFAFRGGVMSACRRIKKATP